MKMATTRRTARGLQPRLSCALAAPPGVSGRRLGGLPTHLCLPTTTASFSSRGTRVPFSLCTSAASRWSSAAPRRHYLHLHLPSSSSSSSTRPLLPASVLVHRSASRFSSSSFSPSSSTAIDAGPDFTPIDIDGELARLQQEVEEGHNHHQAPAPLSSPTRVVGLLVAAGGAGRSDVVQRVLELVDASGSAHNLGLLRALLAQASHLRMLDVVVVLLERLEAVESNTSAAASALNQQEMHSVSSSEGRRGEEDKQTYDDTEQELDRPHAYYNAFLVLIQEYARANNVLGLIRSVELMSRSGTKANLSMRSVVTDLMEAKGVRAFLGAIKHPGIHTQPVHKSSSGGNIRDLHPSTFAFFLRCAAPLLRKSHREESGLNTDILRIATLATNSMSHHRFVPGANNLDCFRALIDIYRITKIRAALFNLLMSFDRYNIKLNEQMLEGLPWLHLEETDKILSKVRKVGGAKPSIDLYGKIAQYVNSKEPVSNFMNYFVANYKHDHPASPMPTSVMNNALFCYAKGLELHKATTLFNLMHPPKLRLSSTTELDDKERICDANALTYVTYINMLTRIAENHIVAEHGQSTDNVKQQTLEGQGDSKRQLVDLGIQVFDLAQRQQLVVPPAVYKALIKFFVTAKEIGRATMIFNHMKKAGHDPAPELYHELIQGLREVGNNVAAQDLERQLRNI